MALYHVFQRKFSELTKDSHVQKVRFVRKGYDKEDYDRLFTVTIEKGDKLNKGKGKNDG